MSDSTNKKELNTCILLINGVLNEIEKRQHNPSKFPLEKSWEIIEIKNALKSAIVKIDKVSKDQ